MSYEIMIPDASELPAHIINTELARQANEDAGAGISSGYPARIKMSGKQFVLVNGNGEETAIPMGKLFKGPDDNLYLKTIVLRAKKALQKRFYLEKFDPKKDGQAPDCFSNDGERPDSTIPSPQCDSCANCPHNAFGSGVNEDGNSTGGKACTDNKMLAVYIPPLGAGQSAPGIHELKVTPASLKNWGLYVKALTSRGISIGNVFTLVGFVSEATFPVLTFQYGGAIPESGVAKLAEMAMSSDAEEIVNSKITFSQKALPAPKADDKAEKAAAAKAEKAAKAAAKKAAEAKAAESAPVDDLGLGSELEVVETVAQEGPATDDLGLSDDDIANELGL